MLPLQFSIKGDIWGWHISNVVQNRVNNYTCECPYHVHGKGCRCIYVVEYMLLQNAESSAMNETIIDEMNLKCTECGSQEYVKNAMTQSASPARNSDTSTKSAGTDSGTIWALRVAIRHRCSSHWLSC